MVVLDYSKTYGGEAQSLKVAGLESTVAITVPSLNSTGQLNGTDLFTNGVHVNSQTAQTLTGPGAVNLTTNITRIVTTGADALTLANGVEGQEKYIVMKERVGNAVLTPTGFANGTTLTFDGVGDTAHLVFTNGKRHFMGGTATIA